MAVPPFRKVKVGDSKLSADDYNRMGKYVRNMLRSLLQTGVVDSTGTWTGKKRPAKGEIRMAQTTQAAPADVKITANLLTSAGVEITSGGESGIDVYCLISPNTTDDDTDTLDEAIPRLVDNQWLPVKKWNGEWWCLWGFQKINETQLEVDATDGLQTELAECT